MLFTFRKNEIAFCFFPQSPDLQGNKFQINRNLSPSITWYKYHP